MQQALQRMGHEVWTDATRAPRRVSFQEHVVSSARAAAKLTLRGLRVKPYRFLAAVDRAVDAPILQFPHEHISEVRVYQNSGQPDRDLLNSFDAFVVGSDQIWRPEMMNVASNLMSFLEPWDRRPRVAYAGSFGTSITKAWHPHLVAETAALARRLTAVSVREDSGVELCRVMWGIDASRQTDPTMLIDREDYQTIAGHVLPGGLVTYILDQTDAIQDLVDGLGRGLGADAVELYPRLPRSYKEFSTAPDKYLRPRVQDWLAAISRADHVLTDSYHGTVFSILFNRPFLAVVNTRRGAARFETLLRTYGLEDRVAKFDGHDVERMDAPIPWGSVNERIAIERARGLGFLACALGQGEGNNTSGV